MATRPVLRKLSARLFSTAAAGRRWMMTSSEAGAAAISVCRLDHLVLTVKDIQRTCQFYSKVLGMEVVTFGGGRTALSFGQQKINLHQLGKEFDPKAHRPTAGSGDLCFVTDLPLEQAQSYVQSLGIGIVEGPVGRTGALGPLRSIYFRDPDLNLIEVANYV